MDEIVTEITEFMLKTAVLSTLLRNDDIDVGRIENSKNEHITFSHVNFLSHITSADHYTVLYHTRWAKKLHAHGRLSLLGL